MIIPFYNDELAAISVLLIYFSLFVSSMSKSFDVKLT